MIEIITNPELYAGIDFLWLFNEPNRIFHGIGITLGTFMVSKLFWMCVYEYKYEAGEEYLQYGKEYIKNKYMR